MNRKYFMAAVACAALLQIVFLLIFTGVLFPSDRAREQDRLAKWETLAELEGEFTRERLLAMAEAGGRWILRMQVREGENTGRFVYRVDAEDTVISAVFDEDNFLRQAGTAYALLVLHEATGDATFQEGARRAMQYLLSRYRVDDRARDRGYFEFEGEVKLGGSALPMLSCVHLVARGADSSLPQYIGPVGRFLFFMQKENGQFRSVDMYKNSREHKRTKWNSAIYPGEAMLALIRMYAVTRDTAYLRSFDRAYRYYSAKPDRHGSAKFMPWTTTAMAEAFVLTRDERYRDFAYRLSDDLIAKEQHLEIDDPVFGAFHESPSINTATYLEGLVDACRIAKAEDDHVRHQRYRYSIFAGFRFLSTLQLKSGDSSGQDDDLRAGGFMSSPKNADIRIDNTQHASSALAKAAMTMF
ncbi:MAG: D-glucuronyl C5-epimerase family protein [Candidatus Hydrogenedentota bacterium]